MNFFDYLMEESKFDSNLFILGDREQISFAELFDQSIGLAQFIRNNYGSGKNVLLISSNSIFFISAYLAILKSGNVCIPIDHAIEQSNLDYILELTECQLIFCSERLLSKLKFKESSELIDEYQLKKIPRKVDTWKSEKEVEKNQLASIVFTSGSTGTPKGVMLSHANLRSNTESILTYLKISNKDRVCNILPFHYCYGLSILHTHLKVGGSMVLNNNFMFLGSVINDIKNYKCTGFSGVPSHFQILLKKSTFFELDLPNLKYFTQAGGKLPNQFIQEIFNAMPDKKFFVMYGQTEATARLSYLSPNLVLEKLGSIGKPIPGVELKIVNSNGSIVEPGVEGDLMAKGENIMLGYYNDPIETSSTIKKGWLCTGDIAIIDSDGFFYIVGRKKQFIKVRGKRVSPNEIISVILELPNVVHCSIEKMEDPFTGEGIKANISVKSDTEINKLQKELLKICKMNLSAYKIPKEFSFSFDTALSSSGKKIINN